MSKMHQESIKLSKNHKREKKLIREHIVNLELFLLFQKEKNMLLTNKNKSFFNGLSRNFSGTFIFELVLPPGLCDRVQKFVYAILAVVPNGIYLYYKA